MDDKVTQVISQVWTDTKWENLSIEQRYSVLNYLRQENDKAKYERSVKKHDEANKEREAHKEYLTGTYCGGMYIQKD